MKNHEPKEDREPISALFGECLSYLRSHQTIAPILFASIVMYLILIYVDHSEWIVKAFLPFLLFLSILMLRSNLSACGYSLKKVKLVVKWMMKKQ